MRVSVKVMMREDIHEDIHEDDIYEDDIYDRQTDSLTHAWHDGMAGMGQRHGGR
jgi:hypothetical protein